MPRWDSAALATSAQMSVTSIYTRPFASLMVEAAQEWDRSVWRGI